jgi:hypothetical protein
LLDGNTIIRWGGYGIGNADSLPYFQYAPNPVLHEILQQDMLHLKFATQILD